MPENEDPEKEETVGEKEARRIVGDAGMALFGSLGKRSRWTDDVETK